LLANVCAKIRAAPADREQSLRRELELHLRGVSCYGSDVLLTHVIPGRAPISGLPEIGTCMSKSAKADLEWARGLKPAPGMTDRIVGVRTLAPRDVPGPIKSQPNYLSH
jgi:hypothetical protein